MTNQSLSITWDQPSPHRAKQTALSLRPWKVLLSWGFALFLIPSLFCVLADDAPPKEKIAEPDLSASDRQHWSFQPLHPGQLPPVKETSWPQNAIDHFILSKLEANQLRPLPAADKLTLLRRVTFDLTGLPPSLDEQHAFLNDSGSDAYVRVVDRLLASPEYGVRWAQHWLDLARFAETDGFEFDSVRPNAWKFRDWVVAALNADLPYDQFVQLQIAGDLLQPGDPRAAIATGWLLCGPDMPDLNLKEERKHVILNEMTSTVGSVFLGLQIGCAQCHDHKFDPLSQADFYRLRACFESAEMFQEHPIPTAMETEQLERAKVERGAASQDLEQKLAKWDETARQRIREKNPDLQPTPVDLQNALTETERVEYRGLIEKKEKLPKLPALPQGRVIREGAARECRFWIRGDFRRPGPVLFPDFPRVLQFPSEPRHETNATGASSTTPVASPREPELQSNQVSDAPRVRLARWLTSSENSLAARVIVNRVWQFHFGEALVRSPSDFGKMGDEPTHPELLDWLAVEFPKQNGSLKWLHRLILLSATYQQASRPESANWSQVEKDQVLQTWKASLAKDPNNLLWGRMPRQRLDGEALRDAMLSLSDALNFSQGGAGVRPPLPQEMVATLLKNQWPVTTEVTEHHRRSLYLFVRRNLRYPLFEAFDRPDTNASCARRNRSTIAPQALILLNSEFSLTVARSLCGRILRESPSNQNQQINLCYQLALGRSPQPDEKDEALQFLHSESERLAAAKQPLLELPVPAGLPASVSGPTAAALTEFCLAILNSNEFVYVD